jgi:mono/diheme cytochrome c family protein
MGSPCLARERYLRSGKTVFDLAQGAARKAGQTRYDSCGTKPMWKTVLAGALLAALIVAILLGIGCNSPLRPASCSNTSVSKAMTLRSPARHDHYVRTGVPLAYRGRRNPFKTTIGNIVEGARLYDLRCAICHGMMGVGDGEAGEKLDVLPADLGRSLGEPLYRDDFFYWSIAEGGARFDTDMPAFKNDLTPGEIWKIVIFMRAAFAESDAPAKDAAAPP